MKKVSLLLSLIALVFVSFAFTSPEPIPTNETEMTSCIEEGVEVSMEDIFGTGKFYGCYISPAFTNVTYELRPQNGGASIFGTIDCVGAAVTLQPLVEYDILITNNNKIWLFLQWEFCNIGGGNPGVSLPAGADQYVGFLYIPC